MFVVVYIIFAVVLVLLNYIMMKAIDEHLKD